MPDLATGVKPANAPPKRQGLDSIRLIRLFIIKRFISRYPPPEWRYPYYRNAGTLEAEYPTQTVRLYQTAGFSALMTTGYDSNTSLMIMTDIP